LEKAGGRTANDGKQYKQNNTNRGEGAGSELYMCLVAVGPERGPPVCIYYYIYNIDID
jgi:hypothetical protein